MPSPFPGMDPFLETPVLFPDLQYGFVVRLSESLNAQLPQPYFSLIAARTWVPDTDDEIREPLIEVYADEGGERLVRVIEVLSLTNKTPGEHGRDLYLQKQREVLQSQVHLVEIDLLRGGTHTTAVPLGNARHLAGAFEYHVCIHRFDRREDYFVYPVRLGARLPTIEIPLLPGDPGVKLDLQAALDHCYDAGLYTRRVKYADRSPDPPLTPEQDRWVKETLLAKRVLDSPRQTE